MAARWLILLGFLHGAWYAAVDLYDHEAQEITILGTHARFCCREQHGECDASGRPTSGTSPARKPSTSLPTRTSSNLDCSSILLSFIQPFVFLSDNWKGRMVKLLLGGSVILPVFVLLELKWGLVAGGIADLGGLLVIIALIGMLVGVLRYSGSLDVAEASR